MDLLKKKEYYIKTFSLCIILALVAHFDLEFQQMNAKVIFFNADQDEEVYIKQPQQYAYSDSDFVDCVDSRKSTSRYI